MSRKALIRLFTFMFAALACLAVFSYTHATSSSSQECTGGEKCEQKKAQTDLILLESLAKHLLSATDN